MADIRHLFNGRSFEAKEPQFDPPERQLRDAMAKFEIIPPVDIVLDGVMRRFDSDDGGRSAKKDKPGWYVAFSSGIIPAGAFGCWRRDVHETWRADIGRELTPDELRAQNLRIAEAKAIYEAERIQRQESATQTAIKIWESAQAASADHPYLKDKGIQPHGARVAADGRLIVPLMDSDGDLSSLQYISQDGEKRYLKNGSTKGRSWFLPTDVDFSSGPVYVAEGYATAATILEQTGRPAVVAYSASNLPAVVETLIEMIDPQQIVIVADNDASGVGQKYADQASAKYGCRVIVMPDPGDANDYYQSGGDLAELLNPTEIDDTWLDDADDLCAQPAPIKWLIRGWLEEESLVMVHGPSAGGKSFVVLDWSMHLASELAEWAGCRVKSVPVAYLAGEGHRGIQSRIAAWKTHHQIQRLNMKVSRTGQKLNTKEGYDFAVKHLKRMPEPPALIIIDTLHKFWNGDENRSNEAGVMIDACEALKREFKCAVLLVHHTGVSQDNQHRARGSTAWRAAIETEISIIPNKAKGNLTISQLKSKNSEELPPLECKLVSIEVPGWIDEDGLQVTCPVLEVVGLADVKGIADQLLENEAKKKAGKKMTGTQQRVIEAYRNAAMVKGTLNGDGLFAGLHVDVWYEEFKALNPDENPSTRRGNFRNARKKLEAQDFFYITGDYYLPKGENDYLEVQMYEESLRQLQSEQSV